MRAATMLSVLALIAAAIACSDDETRIITDPAEGGRVDARQTHRLAHARGLTVTLPGGWSHADERLTPSLIDPREILSVATFPLRYRATGCAHAPGAALEDLGPKDAFVTLQERGVDPGSTWPDFPPRPTHFGPDLGGRSEAAACVPSARFTDHWFTFSDVDRHLHVLVAFGPKTPPPVRDQAWSILESLHIDPSITPDWRASG